MIIQTAGGCQHLVLVQVVIAVPRNRETENQKHIAVGLNPWIDYRGKNPERYLRQFLYLKIFRSFFILLTLLTDYNFL